MNAKSINVVSTSPASVFKVLRRNENDFFLRNKKKKKSRTSLFGFRANMSKGRCCWFYNDVYFIFLSCTNFFFFKCFGYYTNPLSGSGFRCNLKTLLIDFLNGLRTRILSISVHDLRVS